MKSELQHQLIASCKEEMISFLKNNPQHFEEAIDLAIGDAERINWRAAWLLWSCIEKDDPRIKNRIDELIAVIADKRDGHQRELIKILSIMQLNEEQEGTLFNICMEIWESIDKTPSVRWTAFKFILQMTNKYPELSEEVSFLTQDRYLETLSPGIRHSISKALNNLKKK